MSWEILSIYTKRNKMNTSIANDLLFKFTTVTDVYEFTFFLNSKNYFKINISSIRNFNKLNFVRGQIQSRHKLMFECDRSISVQKYHILSKCTQIID